MTTPPPQTQSVPMPEMAGCYTKKNDKDWRETSIIIFLPDPRHFNVLTWRKKRTIVLRNYNHYISGGKDTRNHHPSLHIHNVMRLTSYSLDIVRESNEKMPPILLLSQVAFFLSFLFFLSIIIICFYFHPLFILLYLFIQIKGNLIHTFASNLSSNDFEMFSVP